jgi:hypothetical protein
MQFHSPKYDDMMQVQMRMSRKMDAFRRRKAEKVIKYSAIREFEHEKNNMKFSGSHFFT